MQFAKPPPPMFFCPVYHCRCAPNPTHICRHVPGAEMPSSDSKKRNQFLRQCRAHTHARQSIFRPSMTSWTSASTLSRESLCNCSMEWNNLVWNSFPNDSATDATTPFASSISFYNMYKLRLRRKISSVLVLQSRHPMCQTRALHGALIPAFRNTSLVIPVNGQQCFWHINPLTEWYLLSL